MLLHDVTTWHYYMVLLQDIITCRYYMVLLDDVTAWHYYMRLLQLAPELVDYRETVFKECTNYRETFDAYNAYSKSDEAEFSIYMSKIFFDNCDDGGHSITWLKMAGVNDKQNQPQ